MLVGDQNVFFSRCMPWPGLQKKNTLRLMCPDVNLGLLFAGPPGISKLGGRFSLAPLCGEMHICFGHPALASSLGGLKTCGPGLRARPKSVSARSWHDLLQGLAVSLSCRVWGIMGRSRLSIRRKWKLLLSFGVALDRPPPLNKTNEK